MVQGLNRRYLTAHVAGYVAKSRDDALWYAQKEALSAKTYKKRTHQASNLSEFCWWLKTDSNHRPAGYEMSIFESHPIQISYIFI